jgi:hypothetical protein
MFKIKFKMDKTNDLTPRSKFSIRFAGMKVPGILTEKIEKESGIIGKTVKFRCMPAVAVIGDKDRNSATLHTYIRRGRRSLRMILKPESLPLC